MGCTSSAASQPKVRSASPQCTLLSPKSGSTKGTEGASVPGAYKVDGFVACSEFLKGFKLNEGDEVIVYPDMATLKQSCEEYRWEDDKEDYMASLRPQDVGKVGKCDWLGDGIRVRWADGHWWSFPMEVLAVRLASLPSSQRHFLLDGTNEWVLWSKKVKSASQVENVVEEIKTSGKEIQNTGEERCSEKIVEEIKTAVEEGVQEALAQEDTASGSHNEESKDENEDEEDDEEEDEEDGDDDEEDEDDDDEVLGGGRRSRKTRAAGAIAVGLYQWATE